MINQSNLTHRALSAISDSNNEIAIYHLNQQMRSNPLFIRLIESFASEYTNINPVVDLRMSAGKKVLANIANRLKLECCVDPREAPQLPSYLDESKIAQLESELEPFYELIQQCSSENDCEAYGKALAKSSLRIHPALIQSLIDNIMIAARAVDDQRWLEIGYAYSHSNATSYQ